MASLETPVKLLRLLEAEEDAHKYCPSCQTVKAASGFVNGKCNECFLGVSTEVASVSDPKTESKCVKLAIEALIKNHRAEFDHLIKEERRKLSVPTTDPSQASWVDWKRSQRRRKQ